MRKLEVREENDFSKVPTKNPGRAKIHTQVFSILHFLVFWFSGLGHGGAPTPPGEMRDAARKQTVELNRAAESGASRSPEAEELTPSPVKVLTTVIFPPMPPLCDWNFDKMGTLRFSSRGQQARSSAPLPPLLLPTGHPHPGLLRGNL